jgi:tellurite resistance protein TehA-like permease
MAAKELDPRGLKTAVIGRPEVGVPRGPMLVTLAIWRYIYKRFRLSCDPLDWGAVFPLGMYTVSTYQLAQASDLPFLMWVPRYFIYIAVAAWVATFAGLLWTMRNLMSAPRKGPTSVSVG